MKIKIDYKSALSILGAIALIVQSLGLKVDGAIINEIITGIAAVLVSIGIVTPKEKEKQEDKEQIDQKVE